jgi:hypothetical protein
MPLYQPNQGLVWLPLAEQTNITINGYTPYDDIVLTPAQLGIPANAKTINLNVAFNITMTGAQTPGHLQIYSDCANSQTTSTAGEQLYTLELAATDTLLGAEFTILCPVDSGGVDLEFGFGVNIPQNYTLQIVITPLAWSY